MSLYSKVRANNSGFLIFCAIPVGLVAVWEFLISVHIPAQRYFQREKKRVSHRVVLRN